MSSAPFPASWLKSAVQESPEGTDYQQAGAGSFPGSWHNEALYFGTIRCFFFFFFLRLLVAIPRLLLCILGSYQPRYERAGNNSMNIFLLFFFFLKSNSKLQSYKALLFPFFFFFFFFFLFFSCLATMSCNRIHIAIVGL